MVELSIQLNKNQNQAKKYTCRATCMTLKILELLKQKDCAREAATILKIIIELKQQRKKTREMEEANHEMRS